MLDLLKYMTYQELVNESGAPAEMLKLPPIPLGDGDEVSFPTWFSNTYNRRYICEPRNRVTYWVETMDAYLAQMNTTISRMLTEWSNTLALVTKPDTETLQLKAAPTAEELEDAYTTGGEIRTHDYRIDYTTADALARAKAPFAELDEMFSEFFLPQLLTDTMEDA